jgi:hypothetical protein
MNARPENWNPRTAEEINANSPKNFTYPVLTIVVLAVPGGPYIPIALPRAEDWKPTAPAVEESGFLRRSFHTHNRPNVSINSLHLSMPSSSINRQILIPHKRDTHKRIQF